MLNTKAIFCIANQLLIVPQTFTGNLNNTPSTINKCLSLRTYKYAKGTFCSKNNMIIRNFATNDFLALNGNLKGAKALFLLPSSNCQLKQLVMDTIKG
jgi:hypothetical protein